jgi:hypothetical protein
MACGYTHDEHIARITGLENQKDTEALQYAVYVALDATDASKDREKIESALDYLKKNNNLDKNITYEKIITPNAEHQWYTHLGWDFDYSKSPPVGWTQEMADKQQEIFLLRKQILLHTVKNIFPVLSLIKADSLAALLYYTHIAGDLRYNNTPDNMISIPELVSGFDRHLHILFGEKATDLVTTIKSNLNGVSFENDAEPLDKTLDSLFENVPLLIKSSSFIAHF